jgi:hypothetical protein
MRAERLYKNTEDFTPVHVVLTFDMLEEINIIQELGFVHMMKHEPETGAHVINQVHTKFVANILQIIEEEVFF